MTVTRELHARHEERVSQHGADHDDTHSIRDWTAFITRHTSLAEKAEDVGDMATVRDELIEAGGLIISALKSLDRRTQK